MDLPADEMVVEVIDLFDIPEVFSVILCFLQVTDTAVLCSKYFQFRGNVSRCIRSLVLREDCCNGREKRRALRLLALPSVLLKCLTGDTRLQFVHFSIDVDPGECDNLRWGLCEAFYECMEKGYFQYVRYIYDNMNICSILSRYKGDPNDFHKHLSILKSGDVENPDITEYLNLHIAHPSMCSLQSFSVFDSAICESALLGQQKYNKLTKLQINEISTHFGTEGLYDAMSGFPEALSCFMECFNRARFPCVRSISFLSIEPLHVLYIFNYLIRCKLGLLNSGCKFSCDKEDKNGRENTCYGQLIWNQVEEIELDFNTEEDEFSYHNSFFHVKNEWVTVFQAIQQQVKYHNMMIADADWYPTLFPNIRNIVFRAKLPCWKLMKIFETKTPTDACCSQIAMNKALRNPTQEQTLKSAYPYEFCFADIYSPCPCLKCAETHSIELPTPHGVSITCLCDDDEMNMYLSSILLHSQLNVVYLDISSRSECLSSCDEYDDNDEGNDPSHVRKIKACSSDRSSSLYSSLLDAIERGALSSLRILRVNVSFLNVCGCFSTVNCGDSGSDRRRSFKPPACDNFLLLECCECLEKLIVDLDMISLSATSVLLNVFVTFIEGCLLRSIAKNILGQLKDITFVVKSPEEFNVVFSSIKHALQAEKRYEPIEAPLITSYTSSNSKITIKVMLKGLKNCVAGFLARP